MKGVTDSLASSQSRIFYCSVTLDYQNTNWFTVAPQRAGWRSGIYSSWELSGRVSAGASSAFQAVRLKPGLGSCVTTKPPTPSRDPQSSTVVIGPLQTSFPTVFPLPSSLLRRHFQSPCEVVQSSISVEKLIGDFRE